MRFNRDTEGPQVPSREPITYQAWLAQQGEDHVVVNTPEIDALIEACLTEPSAAELVAEHTGDDTYLFADKIADRLAEVGVRLTSAERCIIATVITDHRSGK